MFPLGICGTDGLPCSFLHPLTLASTPSSTSDSLHYLQEERSIPIHFVIMTHGHVSSCQYTDSILLRQRQRRISCQWLDVLQIWVGGGVDMLVAPHQDTAAITGGGCSYNALITPGEKPFHPTHTEKVARAWDIINPQRQRSEAGLTDGRVHSILCTGDITKVTRGKISSD